jgi:hypothetical protein
MKKLLFVLSIVAVLSLLAVPAFAADAMTCDHNGTTIQSLHDCVMHAYDMGHITNKRVENRLMTELDGAHAALDRGHPDMAIKLLHLFVHDVKAQSGKSIVPEHAQMLTDHAHRVIAALDD